MVSTCANPECTASFRHLSDGRLFLVDAKGNGPAERRNHPSPPEYFWLCGRCVLQYTLYVGPGNRVRCVPRDSTRPLAQRSD